MGKLKVLELFGGIGAPRAALERAGIDYEIVDYVEIDRFAVQSYNAIWDEHYQPQDITQWNKTLDVDLIFHGSPCQDFSLAGNGKGGAKGSGTRSSLMWYTVKQIERLKPKIVIWENVKNVLSDKHKPNFDNYISELETLGYQSWTQVLNAKDYGVAQNRERVFVVSMTSNEFFLFPEPIPLLKRLKDYLEDDVDEKYYLTQKQIDSMMNSKYESGGIDRVKQVNETANTIHTMGGGEEENPKYLSHSVSTVRLTESNRV